MNKRGQEQIGLFLTLFVVAIVSLALYQGLFGFIGDTTGVNTLNFVNQTITMPVSGSFVDLNGQDIRDSITVIVTNATGNATIVMIVPTTNYSLVERVGSDGVKGVALQSLGGGFASRSVNISYGAFPDGYIDDSGSRALANLIPIMAAVAIILGILGLIFKDNLKDLIS